MWSARRGVALALVRCGAAFGFDLKGLETLWQEVECEKGQPSTS
jgi:hypothetical protein